MKDWRKSTILPNESIISGLEVLEKSALQILLVTDENNKLLGVLTDGDIRRAILNKVPLDSRIIDIANKNPCVLDHTETQDMALMLMMENSINHIPVIDEDGKLIKLEFLESILNSKSELSNLFVQKIEDEAKTLTESQKTNPVVLMVGGLGSRLKELTKDKPKPLLEVGDKPILETILKHLKGHGFSNFYFSVNYKSDMIMEHFKDGSDFGVNIQYLKEEKRLGTAGALSMLAGKIDEPFIVMNGDILSNMNFTKLLEYHHENRSLATMCVREYSIKIPYGVVKTSVDDLLSIEEKPVEKFFVNAGVYCLSPKVIDVIPKDRYFEMTELFEILNKDKHSLKVFPIYEYWMDIGKIDDYKTANEEYSSVFSNKLK